ncbi:hypothetical protein AAF712_009766 [Marasmius tenuissimus]|uniref:DUF6535 domain-containing protein n=1 Tax=Marasmius tenuissimus TaxID=585030 RepID=A0ABR2ZP79_9AGAR
MTLWKRGDSAVLQDVAVIQGDAELELDDKDDALVKVGGPELGTKPLRGGTNTEAQETDEALLGSTSVKEELLPHTTGEDAGEDKANTAPGVTEKAPLDGTKDNNPAGNQDTANEASDIPKPAEVEKSWEVVMKEVTALDEGLTTGWKEDIDTLLVFAGLFSAVVTAFTIESYQWLQEAPADTTVVLLKQISQQLNNSPVSEPDDFTVSSSVVAINILWFLSLIIALVDALFALLCKQWLREHRRHTHTRTPSEALALRWLRHQSLEKWRVPAILASLPMLLELALFLFLAGLLELLRTRQPVLFKIATAVVAFAALFYFGTTIIPTVDVIRQARQVTWKLRNKRKNPNSWRSPVDFIMTLPPMEYICPYKSPQAWAVFQVSRFISHILGLLCCVASFFEDKDWITISAYRNFANPILAFGEIISSLSDWSSVDLELLQRSSIDLAPPFYELKAFRWLVAELRDSPHMIPHLRNILSKIPLHLVMPTVLDQWFFLPAREWAVSDIGAALDLTLSYEGIDNHLTSANRQFLSHERETGQLNRLLHWTNVLTNGGSKSARDSPLFPISFDTVDANPDNHLRGRLWSIYAEIIQSSVDSDKNWAALMKNLAPYIIASSPNYTLNLPTTTTTSAFVKSAAGHNFLFCMHSTILDRAIYNYTSSFEDDLNWMEAMDIIRRVHKLPEDHFRVIPGHFSLPLSKLRKTLNGLSPTDPEIDFGYLDSLSGDWGGAKGWHKWKLVEILSKHINECPQSDAKLSHCPGESKISPLVMSSAGLELITFVNNCLAEERETYKYLDLVGLSRGMAQGWRDAIERVRAARPELPPDQFKHIYHSGIDSPAHEHPSRPQEAKAEAQAEGPSAAPRDVTDPGELDRVEQVEGHSDLRTSPQPRPGELDERGPLVENAEQESIPMQLVATGNPASGSAGSPAHETIVGGPDADKNV